MPDSWRRSGVDKPTSSPLHRWKTQLVEAFRKAWDRSKEYIVPVLPALLVSTAIWYQRESLNIIFSTIWKSISSIRLWKTKGNQQQVEVKVPKRKNRFMFGGNNAKEEEFVRKIKAPRVKVNRVDVLNLEGARKKSLWDKLALKFAIWKRN